MESAEPGGFSAKRRSLGFEVVHLGIPLFSLGLNPKSPRIEIDGVSYLSLRSGFWKSHLFKSDSGRRIRLGIGPLGSKTAQFGPWKAIFKARGQNALCVELKNPHALRFCFTMLAKNRLRLRVEGSGFAALSGLEWSELLAISLLIQLNTRRSSPFKLADYQPADRIYLEFEGPGFYPTMSPLPSTQSNAIEP